jgi:hypothetical protein
MGIFLIRMPCGCVIEAREFDHAVDGYIECSWCKAVFCGIDFHDWLQTNANVPSLFIESHKLLINFADQLLEVVNQCQDCGKLIVRGRGERERVHLDVPNEYLQFLRN